MKVMHIITGLNVGGAELMLKRLMFNMVSCSKSDVTIVSLIKMGTVGFELQEAGFTVLPLNMKNGLSILSVLFQLKRLISQKKPDIVQTWLYHADLLGGVAARLAGVKKIVWGIRTTELKKGSYATACIRSICSVLSYIVPSMIVNAAEVSKEKHIQLGYCAKKMTVISNGFDFSQLTFNELGRSSLRLAAEVCESTTVIGYLGRFSQVKGPDIFVAAAGLVAKQSAYSRFLMVGRGFDASNVELMAWIRATGFPERFILLGERQDVASCLSAMDVFCLSSRNEGFPNALAEAMALGLPCVATCAGDAAFILSDTGLLTDDFEPKSVSMNLLKVLDMSPEERAVMGQRAASRVRSMFSIEKSVKQFEELYSTLA